MFNIKCRKARHVAQQQHAKHAGGSEFNIRTKSVNKKEWKKEQKVIS